jgi:hypothetical protein
MRYRITEAEYDPDGPTPDIVHENFDAKNDKAAIAHFEEFKVRYAEANEAYGITMDADLELLKITQVEKTKCIATS